MSETRRVDAYGVSVLICNHCEAEAKDCVCGGVWGSRIEKRKNENQTAATKPVIYLSGPMTGIEDFNYPAFNHVASWIREAGYPVFNPTETFGGVSGLPKETYMTVDLAAVDACDIVVVLPGWAKSEGAMREVERAVGKGKRIQTVESFAEKVRTTHRERNQRNGE